MRFGTRKQEGAFLYFFRNKLEVGRAIESGCDVAQFGDIELVLQERLTQTREMRSRDHE